MSAGPDLPHEAHLAALAALPRMGPASLRRVLTLGTPAAVWQRVCAGPLPEGVVRSLPPGSVAAAADWPAQARAIDPAALWGEVAASGAGAVSFGSPGYPQALAADPDPPVLLFHLGDPDVLVAPRVAVIGTRRATGYGLRVAHQLGRDLAAAGVCVVSGLALGIDAAAHRGALAAADGAPPAAVVGGGLDAPGPRRNADAARDIAARGVILSEVPPGIRPLPWRFPVRNRVLAGLAQAVVVVESAAAGGSMVTVQEAQTRDRPVLAVPGPVDSHASVGTNLLLGDGAHLCTGARDVLDVLSLSPATLPPSSDAGPDPRPVPTGDAARVLDGLGWRPCTVEQLALRTGLSLGPLAGAIGRLESDGWVSRGGGFVERSARPAIRAGEAVDAYRHGHRGPGDP